MKIRDGFVTNSSSTNFLIISKEKLTTEYLLDKLGFKGTPFEQSGMALCEAIIDGVSRGPTWHNSDKYGYKEILKMFGNEAAEKYKELAKNGCKVYVGCTEDSSNILTTYFTLDCTESSSDDFYLNKLNSAY